MTRFWSRANRIVKRLNHVLFLVIVVLAIYFLVTLALVLHQVPARYTSFVIHQTSIQAGQTVTYDFGFCRYVGPEVTTNVVQNLAPVDSKGVPLKGSSPVTLAVSPNVSAGKGCSTAKTRALVIPTSTPPGCYKVHRIGQYYKLVGFKPTSVDIYSNTVCVKAAAAPDVQTQIQNLQQQLDQLQAETGLTVSEAPQPIQPVQVAENSTAPASAAQTGSTQATAAPQAPVQQPTGIVQSTINFLTDLL